MQAHRQVYSRADIGTETHKDKINRHSNISLLLHTDKQPGIQKNIYTDLLTKLTERYTEIISIPELTER